MSISRIDRYLDELRRELIHRGIVDRRLLEEARGHLSDAAEAGRSEGRPDAEAVRDAIRRFGSPAEIAERCLSERGRLREEILLVVAALLGLAIAYVDSRPTWDDTGVTAIALFAAAALLGFLTPRRAWLWGITIGVWTVGEASSAASPGPAAGMLIILAFPLAGAYAGMLIRRYLVGAWQSRAR